jgi:hypothetical protein
LEDELSKMKCEAELQHENERRRVASFNEELKITQVSILRLTRSSITIPTPSS